MKQIHISSSNRGGRVVIHIGPHKTGSTAIQSSLNSDVYRKSLVSDNYILLPVQHGFTMKKVLKNCFDGYCPDNVIQQIRKAKKNKLSKNIVISSEQFDYYRPIEKIQSFLDDFHSIQIVVVYRRFYEWLPSQYSQMRRGQWHDWQTRGKGKVPDNLVTFIAKRGIQDLFKNERYSINAYNNYKDHFNTSWLNFHDGDIVKSFFCSAVLNAPKTCSVKSTQDIKLKNTSPKMKLAYDEIVTAAYDAGLLNGTAISRKDARLFLNKYQQNHIMDELPKICLPEGMLKELLTISIEAEREYYSTLQYTNSSTVQHEEEEELIQKFEIMKSENAFCSINTTHVLADPKWRKALAEMSRL